MAINNMGDLRGVLADAIDGIKTGTMDVATANGIAKLAGRINEGLFAEIAARKALRENQEETVALGQLNIRSDDRKNSDGKSL